MKNMLVVLMILLIALPVRAGIVTDLDPVEETLIKEQKEKERKAIEQSDSISFKKPTSRFWLWTLVILAAGAAAAASSGGGGGGSSGSGSNSGSWTATW